MTKPRTPERQRTTAPIYVEADFEFVDAGIRREMTILSRNGIETFESCEGGRGTRFLSLPCGSSANANRASKPSG